MFSKKQAVRFASLGRKRTILRIASRRFATVCFWLQSVRTAMLAWRLLFLPSDNP
ncbi:MAG: hypothetical protein LBT56_04145 [Prevotellaceae bacterium]|nr:hypothetical protein [Prevotellaceae bacterium]